MERDPSLIAAGAARHKGSANRSLDCQRHLLAFHGLLMSLQRASSRHRESARWPECGGALNLDVFVPAHICLEYGLSE